MYQLPRARVWKCLPNGYQSEALRIKTCPQISPLVSYPTNTSVKQYSTALNTPCEIPTSLLESKAHPLGWRNIQAQVEPYFGNNWKFASEKEKRGFLALGLSRAFSHFFPLTLNDRIDVTCKMLYLSLLIDGEFS